MNGIHDLGGMHGMGPIRPEANEPVFHEDWERRVFGVMIATFAGGQFNVDEFRHAIERMDPAHYLESSYYEHWGTNLPLAAWFEWAQHLVVAHTASLAIDRAPTVVLLAATWVVTRRCLRRLATPAAGGGGCGACSHVRGVVGGRVGAGGHRCPAGRQ